MKDSSDGQESRSLYEEGKNIKRTLRRTGLASVGLGTILATGNYLVAGEAITSPYVSGGFLGAVALLAVCEGTAQLYERKVEPKVFDYEIRKLTEENQ